MKKVVISISALIIMISAVFFACSKNSSELDEIQDPVVLKFLSSETFARFKNTIESKGKISYKEIKSGILKYGNEEISVLGIPLFSKGKKVGIIEVIDLKSSEYLPNGDSYALNLVDMTNFNLQTSTGRISMYDLNYDCFLHSKFEVKNNLIKSFTSNDLPIPLLNKYKRGSRLKGAPSPDKDKHLPPFDDNGNGDISFTECYKGINEAIDRDGFSSFVCDVPIAGWASCWASVSAACVYISAKY
jgi:hypothetical protein